MIPAVVRRSGSSTRDGRRRAMTRRQRAAPPRRPRTAVARETRPAPHRQAGHGAPGSHRPRARSSRRPCARRRRRLGSALRPAFVGHQRVASLSRVRWPAPTPGVVASSPHAAPYSRRTARVSFILYLPEMRQMFQLCRHWGAMRRCRATRTLFRTGDRRHCAPLLSCYLTLMPARTFSPPRTT